MSVCISIKPRIKGRRFSLLSSFDVTFYEKYLSEICVFCKLQAPESIKALKASGATGAPPAQIRTCNFVVMNCDRLNLRLLGDTQ
jgi:hypothetical protein